MKTSFRLFAQILFATVILGLVSFYSVLEVDAEDAAIENVRLLAEQGDADAQCNLGLMYNDGKGVPQDYKEAVKWYRMAAEQGDAFAQYFVGIMYASGKGVPQDYKEAVKWYTKGAEQGNAWAQYELARNYYYGSGITQDYKEAAKWCIMAAEQGHAWVQCFLGHMYYSGKGVPQDYKEAVKWYRMAAEQGDADAQCNLGVMYGNGQGVPQDYGEALKWRQKAAHQGNALAQGHLGVMYGNGQGVPQDYIKAYAWYNLSAAQGDEHAKELRDYLSHKMTPQQIAAAQELSAQLLRKVQGSDDEQQNTTTKKDDSQIKGTGTGFIISKTGHVLTCHHVIEGTDLINVHLADKTYSATLVRDDPYNDLALLKISGNFPALAFSNERSAKMGEEIFTIGYPNPGLQGMNAKFTKGEISSLTGYGDDLRLYQISVPVQPGNSGGPLLDMDGNVKGIIVAVLDVKTAFQITGEIPQNVNYAIKSTYALALLDTLQEVSEQLPSPNKKGISFDKVVDSTRESTVMVLTY